MLSDLFDRIKEQEEKANQSVLDAKAKARDILKSVEAKIADEQRSALQENRELLSEKLEEGRRAFSKTIEEKVAKDQENEDKKIDACRSKLDGVADFIVEKVMANGNS